MRHLLILLLLLSPAAQAAGLIPPGAQAHQRELVRHAQAVWGLGAPVALFAAQVHQESGWRSDAKSRYADGLAQFTPSTAAWIAEIYPDELGEAAPYSPGWALRALVRYDRHLYDRVRLTAGDCDRWAMVLSAYNGGLGWVRRDRRLCEADEACDPGRWWGHVERHTARADWARRENRGYPRRILRELEPRYMAAGWRGVATCPAGA